MVKLFYVHETSTFVLLLSLDKEKTVYKWFKDNGILIETMRCINYKGIYTLTVCIPTDRVDLATRISKKYNLQFVTSLKELSLSF